MKKREGYKVEFLDLEDLKTSNPIPLMHGSNIYCYSIKGNNYNKLTIYNNVGNCKHAFISNLGDALSIRQDNEAVLDELEVFFKRHLNKVMFTTTLVDREKISIIGKRFPLVYCVEVPIGYDGRMQYHCGFMTNDNSYHNYNRYLKRVQSGEGGSIKKYGITQEMKEKILSYKRKFYLDKYLNKLIS